MIVEFKFNYTNKENFLAYFLDFYAKQSSLEYAIHKQDNDISLFVEGDEKELLDFSDKSMVMIPNSVFLNKSEVKIANEIKSSNFEIPKLNFSNLTPVVVKNYVNHSGSMVNECGIFSNISVFYENKFVKITEENYKKFIEICVLNLTHNQILHLKDKNDEFFIKNDLDFTSNFIMPTSFKSIDKAFIVDEKNYIALSSYEKPVINLKLNAIFRQNHQEAPIFFDVKAASDFFIFALLDKLYGNGINFVSIKGKFTFKVSVLDEEFLVIKNEEFKKETNKDLFEEICDEFNIKDQININILLSKTKPDSIKIYNKNKAIDLLKFPNFNTFEELKESIAKDETGKKLLVNFEKEFKFPIGKISKTDSFYSFFEIVAKILFDKDALYLVESAKDSVLKKGPSIDYKIENYEFNAIKFIRSGMSFKLAGVGDKVLSYGYLQSLIYFLDKYLESFEYDNAILTGNLFEEKIISNLAIKNLKAKFSKYLGV